MTQDALWYIVCDFGHSIWLICVFCSFMFIRDMCMHAHMCVQASSLARPWQLSLKIALSLPQAMTHKAGFEPLILW